MKKIAFITTFILLLFVNVVNAQDGVIGEIRMFAGNFEPRSWAFCDGRLLAITQNPALFSILGTTYGGDGRTTFGLPDLRGRAPMHFDAIHPLGQQGGQEVVTLSVANFPAHTHSAGVVMAVNTGTGDSNTPIESYPAKNTSRGYEYAGYSNATMGAGATYTGPATTGFIGGNQPHENMQPYGAINYIICLYGIFPSRN